MDFTEWIFFGAIVMVYPWFFYKLYQRIAFGDDEQYSRFIRDFDYSTFDDANDGKSKDKLMKEEQEREKKHKAMELKNHIMMVGTAIVSLIVSTFITAAPIKGGIGVGGLILLIWSTYEYWNNYKNDTKLIITGVGLAIIILAAWGLYKKGNISDAFTMEFGTKKMKS